MITNVEKNPTELEGLEGLLREQRETINGAVTRGHRKWHARRRLMILDERFSEVILDKLWQTYYDAGVKARLRRHIGVAINPGADITRALACVYDQHPRRRLDDGTEDENSALLSLNDLTSWRLKSKEVNRKAWFTGPVLEMPVFADGVLRRDLITADNFDVLTSDRDPLGQPIAAAYKWQEGGLDVIKVVDDRMIYTYPVEAGDPISVVPHGVLGPDGKPRFPGTLHRYDCPTDINDYYSIQRNERLVDATIECGTIYTAMSWVRKSQNRKIIAAIGNLERLGTQSAQDPERPLLWDVSDENVLPKLTVEDVNTPIDGFRDHIMFIYRTQIESYGIPQDALTYDFQASGSTGSGASVTALNLQHDQKTKLRNDQIPHALKAEHHSQCNLLAVARANGMPEADALPDIPEFAERLEIEFPELTRVEDPKTRQVELDWELKRGLTTDAHIYQMSHTELTLPECRDRVLANLEMQSEFNEFKASRELDPAAEMLDDNEATGATRGNPDPEPDPEQED